MLLQLGVAWLLLQSAATGEVSIRDRDDALAAAGWHRLSAASARGMILRLLFAVVLLSACSTQIGKDGRSTTTVDGRYLLKTEIDRVADTTRRDVVDGLLRIADKLYRRNPREWKQAGQPSREAAVQRLRQRMVVEWPERLGIFIPEAHLAIVLIRHDTHKPLLTLAAHGDSWLTRLPRIHDLLPFSVDSTDKDGCSCCS